MWPPPATRYGEGDRRYGILQVSDKAGGGYFTPEEADRLRELAAYAGAALDAFRAASSASGSG